jgi:hypothetical protein
MIGNITARITEQTSRAGSYQCVVTADCVVE